MTKHSSQRIIIVGATSGIGRVMIITENGTIIRLEVKDINILGRTTQGVAETGSGSHLHPQH